MSSPSPTCASICGSNCDSYSAAHMTSTTSWPRQCVCRSCVTCGDSYTAWSDSPVNTGCTTQTRTAYDAPSAWGSATGWTTSGAYSKTTSRKPVTRTTIHYAG